jgi:hypothetical protein
MYGFLTKLVLSKRLKLEEGKITIFDEPFAFVPMVSLVQMTKDAVERGTQALNDLYFYGWVYGYEVTRHVLKSFGLHTGLQSFNDRYSVVMNIVELVGFGDYKTSVFKVGDARFKNFDNPFALKFYPSNAMVDHYLRGMNAGGGTLVHEVLINCIELECAAINGKYCNFVNASNDTLKQFDQNLVNSQLDLNYLTTREKKFIEEMGDELDTTTFKLKINL